MKNFRTVVILGAGAAIPFGGKTTKELTELVIDKCRAKDASGANLLKTIQELYWQSLNKIREKHKTRILDYNQSRRIPVPEDIKNQISPPIELEFINFEIIFSILEYLTELYQEKPQNSLIANRPEWIELFDLTEEWKKIIPEPEGDNFSYKLKNNPHTRSFTSKEFCVGQFFSETIKEVTEIIFEDIEAYSKNEKGKSEFKNFLQHISMDSKLRIYSLNYDDVISNLFENGEFFNGFDKLITREYSKEFSSFEIAVIPETFQFNLNRTINDLDSNCFYSLHGNHHYLSTPYFFSNHEGGSGPKGDRDSITLNISKVVYSKNAKKLPYAPWNTNQIGTKEIKTYDTRLISGQRKGTRTQIQPYRAFQNIFQKDLMAANRIIAIGFSFNDIHIGNMIRDSIFEHINQNSELEIILIGLKEDFEKSPMDNLIGRVLKEPGDEDNSINFRKKDNQESAEICQGILNNPISSKEYKNIKIKTFAFEKGFEDVLNKPFLWDKITA